MKPRKAIKPYSKLGYLLGCLPVKHIRFRTHWNIQVGNVFIMKMVNRSLCGGLFIDPIKIYHQNYTTLVVKQNACQVNIMKHRWCYGLSIIVEIYHQNYTTLVVKQIATKKVKHHWCYGFNIEPNKSWFPNAYTTLVGKTILQNLNSNPTRTFMLRT